jgi:hypothetical protein
VSATPSLLPGGYDIRSHAVRAGVDGKFCRGGRPAAGEPARALTDL